MATARDEEPPAEAAECCEANHTSEGARRLHVRHRPHRLQTHGESAAEGHPEPERMQIDGAEVARQRQGAPLEKPLVLVQHPWRPEQIDEAVGILQHQSHGED